MLRRSKIKGNTLYKDWIFAPLEYKMQVLARWWLVRSATVICSTRAKHTGTYILKPLPNSYKHPRRRRNANPQTVEPKSSALANRPRMRWNTVNSAHLFSRKHPLACWVSCMLSIYGGQMLASFILGEPIISPFKNTSSLLIATGAWYVIFYSPFDFGYKVFKFLPIKLILAVMKEVIRCKKVHDGVVHAAKIYPNSYIIMIIVGTLKGNGTAFLKILERLLRGVWTPSAVELMQMSFPSKACIAASVIFVLDKKTELISAPHVLVHFGVIIFFIYFKLSSMLLGIHDPFVPFENLFCALFLGGIWDTLQRLLTPASKGDQPAMKGDTAKNGKTDSAKKKE